MRSNATDECVLQLGYWGGISPVGNIAKKYRTRVVRKNDGGFLTVVDADDVQRFYHDFYLYVLISRRHRFGLSPNWF